MALSQLLYRAKNPLIDVYAGIEANFVGLTREPACSVCGIAKVTSPGRVIGPWTRSGKKAGSFVWGATRNLVVQADLGRAVLKRFPAVQIREVLLEGTRFPGVRLVELFTERIVEALPQSTFKLERDVCTKCGSRFERLAGGESVTPGSKGQQTRIPRLEGQGLFVNCADVDGAGLFVCKKMMYATAEFRAFVFGIGATNVDFLEAGECVPQERVNGGSRVP